MLLRRVKPGTMCLRKDNAKDSLFLVGDASVVAAADEKNETVTAARPPRCACASSRRRLLRLLLSRLIGLFRRTSLLLSLVVPLLRGGLNNKLLTTALCLSCGELPALLAWLLVWFVLAAAAAAIAMLCFNVYDNYLDKL